MRAENTELVNCPSCGAQLVTGLRFCRMCGYRLGEGVEEYVATQRFDASSMPTAAQANPATDPFAPRQTWGAAPIQTFGATSALKQPEGAGLPWAKPRATKRGGWWLWLTIGLVLLIAVGMIPAALISRNGGPPPAPKPFMGVDGFETAPGGGAFIVGIAGPETPVVRAGLIGGDIIKSFDGTQVRNAGHMRELLARTPVGKTVEVVYVRDGVTATTALTPVAQRDTPGRRLFDQRPGGAGDIEINRGDVESVTVPGMNISGAELGDIERNGPADIAGLREGDIVIKFGEHPVRTPGDLRYRISEALPGTTVPVLVVRGAERIEIPVKIGRSRD